MHHDNLQTVGQQQQHQTTTVFAPLGRTSARARPRGTRGQTAQGPCQQRARRSVSSRCGCARAVSNRSQRPRPRTSTRRPRLRRSTACARDRHVCRCQTCPATEDRSARPRRWEGPRWPVMWQSSPRMQACDAACGRDMAPAPHAHARDARARFLGQPALKGRDLEGVSGRHQSHRATLQRHRRLVRLQRPAALCLATRSRTPHFRGDFALYLL